VLAYAFVREPRETLAPRPAPGEEKSGGSLSGNLRAVVSERQILVMLGMLFVLWLSTTYVRPVMPISIDDFASHSNRPGGAVDRVSLQLPGMRATLKETTATGLVFGMIGMTSTIAALSVAPLGQRVGYRNAVTGAALLTGIFYIPVFFAGSFTTFLLFFGAVGLFQGAMVPGTNALIAASAPEGKQGSAFGLASSMQSMALLIGPLAGGATSGLLGIRSIYLVIGVILVIAAVAGRFLIREPEFYGKPRRA